VWALAGPAQALATEFGAYERDRCLGHGGTTLPPTIGIYKWAGNVLLAEAFYFLRGTESTRFLEA
jgi:hypothetical protein